MARHPHWRHLRDDRDNFEHGMSIREPHDPPHWSFDRVAEPIRFRTIYQPRAAGIGACGR